MSIGCNGTVVKQDLLTIIWWPDDNNTNTQYSDYSVIFVLIYF